MKKRNKRFLIIFFIIVISSAVYYFFHEIIAYTGDAHIRANWVQISPRVEGHIKSVFVRNNQYVEKGMILMEIEKHPYNLIVNEKRAGVKKAEARLAILKTKLKAATEDLEIMQNKYALRLKKKERFHKLKREEIIPEQEYEDLLAALDDTKAKLNETEEEYKYSEELVAVQLTIINSSKAELALSEYELSMTDIRAPSSGHVTNVYVRPGDFAHKGQPMFGIVANDEWWVEANYKTNLLRKMKPGQKVWISTGLHPFRVLDGKVVSIGYGISRTPHRDKTLPYIKPTMDWIRLERRFPVRIEFVDLPDGLRLRMGANARTAINLID